MLPTTPKTKATIEALWRLEKIILEVLDFKDVVIKIVNGLLEELGYLDLGYRIIVLTLVDKERNVLKRIALSQTSEAEQALRASAIPFHEIDIPLSSADNLLIQCINEKRPLSTHDWKNLFVPVLTSDQARVNQQAAGIKASMVYPVIVRNEVIGVVIFSLNKYEHEVSLDERDLIRGFTDIVGLAVQNARLYSSLEERTKQLRELNEKLKELDHLKDDFVSVASHELRTPMTAIRSYLWMALKGRGGELTEKQQYYLNRAYTSTVRLINLVNDMLNISRIESGRIQVTIQKTDLIELVESVISEVKPRADELGLTLEVKKRVLPSVLADGDKIKEVLINLIGNSLKFTQRGGTIVVSFDLSEDTVVTRVADNGTGISREDQEHLFQKFGFIGTSYKVNKSDSQGTGLGLYISKSIIDMHKGKMAVFSEGIGHGSAFSFSLKTFNDADFATFQREYGEQKSGLSVIHSDI